MSIIKENLLYASTHEWAKIENGEALVGISDFAQHSLGSVVFVDLPSVGAHFAAGKEFGAVESVKAASDLFLPLSGKIIAVNEALLDNPGLVNEDPYGAWIVRIQLSAPNEVASLLTPAQYATTLK